jgi:hypothetical protein
VEVLLLDVDVQNLLVVVIVAPLLHVLIKTLDSLSNLFLHLDVWNAHILDGLLQFIKILRLGVHFSGLIWIHSFDFVELRLCIHNFFGHLL